jgi:uncharacterized protein YndB with AHSA1/START domain
MPESAGSVVIRKSITVAVPVETAFRLFTEQIGTWWPLATKSVAQAEAETLVVEPEVGGTVYERGRDGTVHKWGDVVVWEPPSRVAFTWHPGRGEETRQDVDVQFRPIEGGTRVEVAQTGWERLVATAAEIPDHYESGWDEILRSYAEQAERSR